MSSHPVPVSLLVMAKSVTEWYADQKILITGSTGFMGKILVEKLLRSCPNIEILYLLLRPKKGINPKERLEEFLKAPMFDKLRSQSSSRDIFRKIICVSGDILQKNCGLSEMDIRMLEDDVTLVFHMAADVGFTQPLKTAVLSNVGGTLNLLELARSFKNLKTFVHASTLYCHCGEEFVDEKLYSAPHNPRQILDLVSWMDDSLLHLLTPRLIKNYPNTYAYTKCLSEALVSEYDDIFRIVIVRPSTVTAAWRDPIPGWVDNLNGPTGLIMGAGKGVFRSLLCGAKYTINIIPVDVGINGLLVVACKAVPEGLKNEVEVYHITTSKERCRSWGYTNMLIMKYLPKYPYSITLWYPGLSLKSNYFHHIFSLIFSQYIPAYFLDFLLIMIRRKRFFVNMHRRISRGRKAFEYYTTRPWNFQNRKLFKLYDNLSEIDKEIFFLNRDEFDYVDYMKNYILGIRQYCAKDGLETLPRARKLIKRLKYVQMLKNIILCGLLIWILYIFAL